MRQAGSRGWTVVRGPDGASSRRTRSGRRPPPPWSSPPARVTSGTPAVPPRTTWLTRAQSCTHDLRRPGNTAHRLDGDRIQRVGGAAERPGEGGDRRRRDSRPRSPAPGSGPPTRSCDSRRPTTGPSTANSRCGSSSAGCWPIGCGSRTTASPSGARRSPRGSARASSTRIPSTRT